MSNSWFSSGCRGFTGRLMETSNGAGNARNFYQMINGRLPAPAPAGRRIALPMSFLLRQRHCGFHRETTLLHS
jgi:hypothetical protein